MTARRQKMSECISGSVFFEAAFFSGHSRRGLFPGKKRRIRSHDEKNGDWRQSRDLWRICGRKNGFINPSQSACVLGPRKQLHALNSRRCSPDRNCRRPRICQYASTPARAGPPSKKLISRVQSRPLCVRRHRDLGSWCKKARCTSKRAESERASTPGLVNAAINS